MRQKADYLPAWSTA